MLLKINKPSGYTSYDIVEKIKRVFWNKKVGHSGTLDPMASGLLIIWVWKDTKLLWKFLGADKEYETTIDFSIYSDTWDLDYFDTFKKYEVVGCRDDILDYNSRWCQDDMSISKKDNKQCKNDKVWILKDGRFIPAPSLKQIEEKLKLLIPEIELPLTMFSAKKVNWKKLYELARHGIDLDLKQKMKINEVEILDYSFPKLTLRLNVWSGTYIRSIGYWLWQQFGLPGTLTMLKRTKIGPIKL